MRKMVSGSEGWLTINEGAAIKSGDSVKTAGDSRLEFELPGNGVFRLGPSSVIYIDTGETLKPDLIFGDMWAVFLSDGESAGAELPIVTVRSENAASRFSAGQDCSQEIKVYAGKLTSSRRIYSGYAKAAANDDGNKHPCETEPAENDSLNTLIETVEAGQKMIITSQGRVVFKGPFVLDDPDENSEWVRWNNDRDRMRIR